MTDKWETILSTMVSYYKNDLLTIKRVMLHKSMSSGLGYQYSVRKFYCPRITTPKPLGVRLAWPTLRITNIQQLQGWWFRLSNKPHPRSRHLLHGIYSSDVVTHPDLTGGAWAVEIPMVVTCLHLISCSLGLLHAHYMQLPCFILPWANGDRDLSTSSFRCEVVIMPL